LNICAPAGFRHSLEEAIAGQMEHSYFPIKLQDLSSRIYYTELGEGSFRIGDLLIETRYLNHTAPTLAYRVMDGTATVAYVTDHEPFWNVPGPVFLHPGDRKHVEFLRNADLIIHDAQYTAEEYEKKKGWGHSTIEYATDVAVAARAGKLALFHHDPAHDDSILKDLENKTRERAASFGSEVEIFCAAEGQEIEVVGRGTAAFAEGASAIAGESDEGWSVLVVSQNSGDAGIVRMSLAEENCVITTASDVRSGCAIVAQSCPDVVMMSTTGAGAVSVDVEALRNACGNTELPILLLTEANADDERMVITQGLATDYIAKPFTPAMLRCRIRAWRTRRNGTSTSVPGPVLTRPAGPSEERLSTSRFLASSSLFGGVEAGELLQLTASGVEQVFARGQSILQQGDPSDSIFIVLSGRVRVVETGAESDMDVVLGEFGAGEIFGELGILQNRPRSATVIALDETNCLKIPHADFLAALQNSTELCAALQQIIALRLEHTDFLVARHAPDVITGLPGRRAFVELYQRLAGSARRRKTGLVLLVMDIVQLKRINDDYGYPIGDNLLRAVADTLANIAGDRGLVLRYGGDEFAVLLLEHDSHYQEVITRVRAQLQQTSVRRNLPLNVEYNIGCAFSEIPPESADELVRQAGRDMRKRRDTARFA